MFTLNLTRNLLVIFLLLLGGCVSTAKSPQVTEKAAKYTSLGASYFQHGKMERALHHLKKALDLDEAQYSTHAVIALVYERLQRPEDAEIHFLRAVELVSPDSHEFGAVNNNYAGFLCGQGQLQKAEALFRKAFEHTLYRTPEVALENGGICFYRAGNIVKAEGYFRQALMRNKMMPGSLYHLAELSLQKGERLQARAFIQRYMSAVEPEAKGLLLGVRIEKSLGDDTSAKNYADRLIKQYPGSIEANKVAELM